ncbi:MAG: tRNA threonylcarbamoyladenosine dehydratase [Lachnospiraceae bacterium]|nr:tRNA threonylcarbamoyladenosine dehydratase [Lachnospiraceae bacterium]
MKEQFTRTEMLLGQENMEKLFAARVAVFGLGGVGGYTVEALARSGIGTLDLIDPDKVDVTNLNRQILADWNTIGQYKVDIAKARIRAINPDAAVKTYKTFFLPDNADRFDFTCYDYVVDAIDTVTGKLELAERALSADTPIISCMGAGNRMDASAFEVADIYETSVCPMARVMRRELKKRGIERLKVVYSREPAIDSGQQTPGSNAFTPGAAGLILAGEVVRDLTG